jgi:hypothetical protein
MLPGQARMLHEQAIAIEELAAMGQVWSDSFHRE